MYIFAFVVLGFLILYWLEKFTKKRFYLVGLLLLLVVFGAWGYIFGYIHGITIESENYTQNCIVCAEKGVETQATIHVGPVIHDLFNSGAEHHYYCSEHGKEADRDYYAQYKKYGYCEPVNARRFGLLSLIVLAVAMVVQTLEEKHYGKTHAVNKAQKEQEEAAFKARHPHYEAEQFYLSCKEAGIADIDTQANIARMLLAARNAGRTESDDALIEQFRIGRQDVLANEKADQLAQLQFKEAQAEQEQTEFSECVRLERYAAVCQKNIEQISDEIAVLEGKRKATDQTVKSVIRAGTQKERDWAVAGGMASAIGGTGAGVATALDVQQKNAEIRKQNSDFQDSMLQMQMLIDSANYRKISHAKYRLDSWKEHAEAYKSYLTDSLPEEEMLKKLAPKVEKQSVSETGAVTVSVHLNAARVGDLVIYETVPALLDGSIKAFLMNGETIVGETVFNLPLEGLRDSITQDVIFRSVSEKCDSYTVRFAPNHLWAIERKKS